MFNEFSQMVFGVCAIFLKQSKMTQVGKRFAGEKKCLNSELWHACAGPLVSLPPVGSRVIYFPQGHSEQVIISISPCLSLINYYLLSNNNRILKMVHDWNMC